MISSEPPVLQISELCKSYGKLNALRDVTFSLSAGERLAFLGPNGAGKTTLIRCLAGRTKPDSGTMQLLGRALTRHHPRMSLGLVPQEIAIYSDLTTRENLQAFGKLYGLNRTVLRKRIDWAMQWTGLSDRANDLVGGFSGGMKRRINIACGVLHGPRVLLLDEPTVGVDPQSRQRIFMMLDALNAEGTSILLTTHHLDEAQERSDRIVIMDQGTVVADGDFNSLVASTIGPSRLVRLQLQHPITSPLRNVGSQPLTAGNVGDNLIETRIDDVSTQLVDLLSSVREQGHQVTD
ncbi:MAG: ABC transporter ATP-binding protein, partial [Pirellulaceae bacterium]